MTTPVPGPLSLPLIKNILSIDPQNNSRSLHQLADQYGDIYRFEVPGSRQIVVCSHALVDEVCDEKRFMKVPKAVLEQVRNGVHDGLFTAHIDEPNWGIAHRVLMPAFGPMGIRDMFDEMHDVAAQLALKWARFGPKKSILVTDDFTRLALDTLALCSMGFRFNSFYSEQMHPFIEAMGEFLTQCGIRTLRPPLPSIFYRQEDAQYRQNIDVLRRTAQDVLKERASDPENPRKDLLAAMLDGKDPVTGQRMTDGSIVDNLITFLIAGHETTSGTLSYAIYRLLKNPEMYQKVQEEVDNVIGKGPITAQHMQKFPYISAVLRETLRLDSPIPIFTVQPIEDTVVGGKYPLRKDDTILVFLPRLHLDPEVYDDPRTFKPERMLDENFNQLPKNAWKPFGSGARACIGRPFAWQEAVLALAMLFQNFNFVLDDPDYVLDHVQTLTLKPKDLRIRATLRDGMDPVQLENRLRGAGKNASTPASEKAAGAFADDDTSYQPITILFGSNTGTCESLAQRLSLDALAHGYKVSTLSSLNAARENLPKDQPVVIITPSYEGQPADNAAQFVPWLENIQDKSALTNVRYAVFGCGNHDWAQTFHRIPKLVDAKLEEVGATRIAAIGLADAAADDMFAAFEKWEDDTLWPALEGLLPKDSRVARPSTLATSLQVQISNSRPAFEEDAQEATVIATRSLTVQAEPSKKHLEFQLPPGTSYKAGDYLVVLPLNPRETVVRAMRRFGLARDSNITINGFATKLPLNTPVSAYNILSGFVELGQTATTRDIITLSDATDQQSDRKALLDLAGDRYGTNVVAKQVSLLDLLEKFPSVDLDLGAFLTMVPSIRVRRYSISSSPLAGPSIASITFSLVRESSISGAGEHIGVATSYLDSLEIGDKIHASIRPAHAGFHLPDQPNTTPMILVAAGSGIAPFRAFIQERAEMIASGRKLAPATLYFGCREPGKDDLYREEMDAWERIGAVTVRRAYSRVPKKAGGFKYVQDALWADRETLSSSWRAGAILYICGSRKISQEIDKAAIRAKLESAKSKGKDLSEEEAKDWWSKLRNVKYMVDVFD
ncbi:cytochrome P450 [Xylariales sp. PMI_506]|nr:cytochrome P450 [Xylariales sp. PMI_506]